MSMPLTICRAISPATTNYSVLVGPKKSGLKEIGRFLVRVGGPLAIAVFAIRPGRADIGGYGGSPPREKTAQPPQAGLVARIATEAPPVGSTWTNFWPLFCHWKTNAAALEFSPSESNFVVPITVCSVTPLCR